MGKTSIQWTEFSLNPIRARIRGASVKDSVGHYCVKISSGCRNCYASRLQPRFGLPVFQEQRGDLVPDVFLDVSKLDEVLRRKKPTTYFWCDMTDMFGEWVPDEWIAACFGVMAATPQHTHQVLTKRSQRMRAWFDWSKARTPNAFWGPTMASIGAASFDEPRCDVLWRAANMAAGADLPLPNVVLMVSAENQEQADLRIPDLLACPATVRGISAEPLLGPIELQRFRGWLEPFQELDPLLRKTPRLQWVIIGGESGPKARPYHVEWGERIVEQCKEAGTAVFMKQVGRRPTVAAESWRKWRELGASLADADGGRNLVILSDGHGGDMAEWPEELRIREFP